MRAIAVVVTVVRVATAFVVKEIEINACVNASK